MRKLTLFTLLTLGAPGFFLCSKKPTNPTPPVVVEKPCADLDSTLTFTCCRQWVRDPTWSPDGNTIAYADLEINWGLHLVNPDGSNDHLIVPAVGVFELDFSSDGQWILFLWLRTNQPPGSTGIYKIRTSGKDTTKISSTYDDFYPRWSPDDKLIAFERDISSGDPQNGVYLMNADGTGARQIFPLGQVPDWSPDGRLVVTKGANLYIIDTLGNVLLKLTNFLADSLGRGIRAGSGRWSPKGDLILFTAYENWTGLSYLMVIRPDGSGMQKVPNTLGNYPLTDWAPDGKHIVYTDVDTSITRFGIYSISILGCNKTRIAAPTLLLSTFSQGGNNAVHERNFPENLLRHRSGHRLLGQPDN